MPEAMPARDVLEREFLEIRAKILEIAASLDRLGRGAGSVMEDPRYSQLQQGISLLQSNHEDKAALVQMLFSQPFQDGWRNDFGL